MAPGGARGLERRRTLETRAKLRRVVADHAREMRCALATIDRVADKADAARAPPRPPRRAEGRGGARARRVVGRVGVGRRGGAADDRGRRRRDARRRDAALRRRDAALRCRGNGHVDCGTTGGAFAFAARRRRRATSPPPAARRNRRGDEPSAFESEVRMETLRAELAGSVAAELRRELEPETRATPATPSPRS